MSICEPTCREWFLGNHTPGEAMGIIMALLLLEAVLSFDNAAILAATVRKLPRKDRRKALLYGLVGAYVLRILAIVFVAVLLQHPWLKLVGGGYLLILFVRHFGKRWTPRAPGSHAKVNLGWLVRLGVPPLLATIIQIELIDLAFAIDQVVVAVAFTREIPLIVVAACIGILFLRIAAAFMARVMDWLPLLEHMAYVAVGFVGLKLVLMHPAFNQGEGYHIPDWFTLAATFSLFLVPIVIKLVFRWPPTEEGAHAIPGAEDPEEAVAGKDAPGKR